MADPNSTNALLPKPRVRSKKCGDCRQTKPFKAFTKTTKGGWQWRCRACQSAYRKERRRSGIEQAYRLKTKPRLKDRWLRKRFGITLEQYEIMLKAQDGKCAICGRSENGRGCRGGVKDLAVDHDHKPDGKIRGLLCSPCNQGIGLFKDNPELLEKAIAYLRRHE